VGLADHRLALKYDITGIHIHSLNNCWMRMSVRNAQPYFALTTTRTTVIGPTTMSIGIFLDLKIFAALTYAHDILLNVFRTTTVKIE